MQSTDEERDEAAESDIRPNIAIENMRTELREATLTKRKEDREIAWSKNRMVLGVYRRDRNLYPDYVNERAIRLKRRRISMRDYKHLPNALIQSEEHINAFLKVDQSLSGLVRDLCSNNQTLQLCAANCCCNIALGNAKACTALGKAIAPYLLIKLKNPNPILLDVCIWTIGNLVAGSDKAFSILHAQHCLKYLISLLYDCDDLIFPTLMYTLLHYVYKGSTEISESELIMIVKGLVKRNSLYMTRTSIWLLALLSSSPVCIVHMHSILPQLVDYLYRTISFLDQIRYVGEITASIRILANSLHDSCEDKTDVLLRNSKYSSENLINLLNTLLLHPLKHVKMETLWLIGNLYNHTSSSVSKNIKDILPSLRSFNEVFPSRHLG